MPWHSHPGEATLCASNKAMERALRSVRRAAIIGATRYPHYLKIIARIDAVLK